LNCHTKIFATVAQSISPTVPATAQTPHINCLCGSTTSGSCYLPLLGYQPQPSQPTLASSGSYHVSNTALEQLEAGSLTKQQCTEFHNLIREYADIFAESKNDLSCTNVLEHHITLTPDACPIKQNPYRYCPNLDKQKFIEAEIQRMKHLGIIVE
jgi:hypothetical protein